MCVRVSVHANKRHCARKREKERKKKNAWRWEKETGKIRKLGKRKRYGDDRGHVRGSSRSETRTLDSVLHEVDRNANNTLCVCVCVLSPVKDFCIDILLKLSQ